MLAKDDTLCESVQVQTETPAFLRHKRKIIILIYVMIQYPN